MKKTKGAIRAGTLCEDCGVEMDPHTDIETDEDGLRCNECGWELPPREALKDTAIKMKEHNGKRGFANLSQNYFWYGCTPDCPACIKELKDTAK